MGWKEYKENLQREREEQARYQRRIDFSVMEKDLCALRKEYYKQMKQDVQMGLRNTNDLIEFELWKGF